jgi:hypothetical protein
MKKSVHGAGVMRGHGNMVIAADLRNEGNKEGRTAAVMRTSRARDRGQARRTP